MIDVDVCNSKVILFHVDFNVYVHPRHGARLSASKYNAHTEPLFKNLKLLKIEHILKLHELKLYYKFIHIRLPVYLQN